MLTRPRKLPLPSPLTALGRRSILMAHEYRQKQSHYRNRYPGTRASPRRTYPHLSDAQAIESPASQATDHFCDRAGQAAALERPCPGTNGDDVVAPQGDGKRSMSSQNTPVSIQILEKEYLVACPADEREALMAAAGYLGKKMKEIRDSGKVVGADRIAVIAALNITHELLKARSENEFHSDNLGSRIRALQNKIDAALHDSRQMDLRSFVTFSYWRIHDRIAVHSLRFSLVGLVLLDPNSYPSGTLSVSVCMSATAESLKTPIAFPLEPNGSRAMADDGLAENAFYSRSRKRAIA